MKTYDTLANIKQNNPYFNYARRWFLQKHMRNEEWEHEAMYAFADEDTSESKYALSNKFQTCRWDVKLSVY